MLKSSWATHSGNGVRADRPRMRTRPQPELGPAFRRNRLLRFGLVLLLGVCVLRLAAEAWQRGGRNVYILSAFAGKAARPGLDSAMFYTVETPPVPVESVLTSDVAYGKRLSLRQPPWVITPAMRALQQELSHLSSNHTVSAQRVYRAHCTAVARCTTESHNSAA